MRINAGSFIWAAVAITSGSLGIAIYKAPGSKTDAVIAVAVATLAATRTAKLSRRHTSIHSKLINKREVAQLLGVSKRTVDLWLIAGKLPQPKRKFGLRKWEYDKIAALRKSGYG
jgi:excisionase family DNA binding protein